jgi:hypothetical protein
VYRRVRSQSELGYDQAGLKQGLGAESPQLAAPSHRRQSRLSPLADSPLTGLGCREAPGVGGTSGVARTTWVQVEQRHPEVSAPGADSCNSTLMP